MTSINRCVTSFFWLLFSIALVKCCHVHDYCVWQYIILKHQQMMTFNINDCMWFTKKSYQIYIHHKQIKLKYVDETDIYHILIYTVLPLWLRWIMQNWLASKTLWSSLLSMCRPKQFLQNTKSQWKQIYFGSSHSVCILHSAGNLQTLLAIPSKQKTTCNLLRL